MQTISYNNITTYPVYVPESRFCGSSRWRHVGFQFLLVRLKDLLLRVNLRIRRISIPSGTIKSIYSIKIATALWTFQFLLVRLKAADKFAYNILI